jgi:hypothetical protein
MGSGAMMYIPNFTNTDLGIQKLIWGTHRHIEGMEITKTYVNFFK